MKSNRDFGSTLEDKAWEEFSVWLEDYMSKWKIEVMGQLLQEAGLPIKDSKKSNGI